MMRAFRKSAKPLIFVVAISFFAWLVLDLSGLTGGSGVLTQTSVGKINGRSVDIRVFQQAVAQATEERQRQSPEPLGIAATAQIRDQVWEQFIQQTLLDQEYRKWGISVSSEEIAAVIKTSPLPQIVSSPQFQTDGQFDQAKYELWLASATGQQLVPALEEQYRSQLLQAKLARHLVAPLHMTEVELWERYRDQQESVRLGLVTIEPAVAVDDAAVQVTPTEVEEYYRAHREDLRQEQRAWVSYLALDRRPIGSDTAAALERARQVRGEIAGGAPFAEVARRESSDTVSGNQGGDLGMWRKGSFDQDFEKAAWSIPLNTVSEPVLTRFGYHLVEITKRWADSASGRHILVPIEVTGAHRDLLDARADSLEQLAADRLDPAALDTAARALALPIERAGPMVKDQLSALPADVAVWAFQARPGEHSPVVEPPGLYMVARLDSVQPAGVPPLEAIRAEVEGLVRSQRKQTEARKLAETVSARARQPGTTLEAAAKELSLPYAAVGPFTRITASLRGGQAVGRAFALQPGAVSAPVEGRDVYYVMQAIERVPADSATFVSELPALRERSLENLRQLFLRQYMMALRDKAKIVDQRDQLYKTAAQVEAEAPVTPTGR